MRTLLTSAAGSTALLASLVFPGFSEAQDRATESTAESAETRNGVSIFSKGMKLLEPSVKMRYRNATPWSGKIHSASVQRQFRAFIASCFHTSTSTCLRTLRSRPDDDNGSGPSEEDDAPALAPSPSRSEASMTPTVWLDETTHAK